MEADGRVVDPGNHHISHSEGQGIVLLLAVHYDDPETFALAWNWTRTHLQTRPDRLLSWSWTPGAGVTDANNATDGDLLVAWALARAARRWQNADYLEQSRNLARDIRTLLLRQDGRGPVLLPGMEGFASADGSIVNLSYWVFPAFSALNDVDPAPEWNELRNTGLALLREAHFGRWGLPPDWLSVGGTLAPAADFPQRFGYDAVRIPLYLMWARLDTPELLSPFRDYWGYFSGARFLPAWTDLTNDSIDSYNAGAGIRAISRLALMQGNRARIALPPLDADADYYTTALWLMCRIIQADVRHAPDR